MHINSQIIMFIGISLSSEPQQMLQRFQMNTGIHMYDCHSNISPMLYRYRHSSLGRHYVFILDISPATYIVDRTMTAEITEERK